MQRRPDREPGIFMALPDLELIITRTPGGAATAALRVELPSRRADLVEDVPVTLHDEALRGLLHIPNAYAGALTGMIFVPQLREAWQRALGYAEGAGELLRVRLHLVAAYLPNQGVVLAQLAVDRKENEIVAVPKLLKQLDLGVTRTCGSLMRQERSSAPQER